MIDIRAERKAQGLKLEYIAKKVGMSISYLSLLEKGERRISHSDYKSILNVLGYELIAKKKDIMEDIDVDKELILMNDTLDISSNEMEASRDKLIERLEEIEQDNSALIQVIKHEERYALGNAYKLLINNLPILCDYDKELLSIFNTNLKRAVKLGNKAIKDWSKEESAWYIKWSKYNSTDYCLGFKKRTDKFNVKDNENNFGQSLTIREYTLLNETVISVIYWLNGTGVDYSFETNLSEKSIYTMEVTRRGLCHIIDDKDIIIADETIFNLLSDKDRQELVKITYLFEHLFRAHMGLSTIIIHLISGISGVRSHPERYTDEYREYVKEFSLISNN